MSITQLKFPLSLEISHDNREKEEKRKLEQRIQQMQNQLIPGGASPAAVLRIQKEYELKMFELERERQSIEEDKQQVFYSSSS